MNNITHTVGTYALNVFDNDTQSSLCVDCGDIDYPCVHFQHKNNVWVTYSITKNASYHDIESIVGIRISELKTLCLYAQCRKDSFPTNISKIVDELYAIIEPSN